MGQSGQISPIILQPHGNVSMFNNSYVCVRLVQTNKKVLNTILVICLLEYEKSTFDLILCSLWRKDASSGLYTFRQKVMDTKGNGRNVRQECVSKFTTKLSTFSNFKYSLYWYE